MSKKNVDKMNDQELVAYAIELYDKVVPVAEIMEITGITRTRLYNNLRRRGETPNRQVSTVKAAADKQTAFYKEEADRAREEVGALKYQISLLEAKIAKLSDTNAELNKRMKMSNADKIIKASTSPSAITVPAKRRASKK
tara:strand:- start:117 stop:536 length:420 start_codon:yes stop_codon:yes gene_type:complete